MSNLVKHGSGLSPTGTGERGKALVMRSDGGLEAPQVGSGSTSRPGRLVYSVIAASALAAVAVGAAAFSGGSSADGSNAGSPAAARGSLAASASTSSAASTVAYTLSATEAGPGTQTTIATGSGSFDLSTGVGQLTVSVPSLSNMVGSHDSIEVISDGTNVYLNVPALSALTGGKSWVEASVAAAGSMTGSSMGALSLSTLADPADALGLLGSLGSTVTKVGTVQLDGTPATEYQTTVSIADIESHLGQGTHQSGSTDAVAKALQQLGVPSIPVTAWVGTDGMLRQLSVTVDLSHATIDALSGSGSPTPSRASGSTFNVTVGFSHYGEPVSVSVPPASDVTDLDSIASSLRGAASKLGGALTGIVSRV